MLMPKWFRVCAVILIASHLSASSVAWVPLLSHAQRSCLREVHRWNSHLPESPNVEDPDGGMQEEANESIRTSEPSLPPTVTSRDLMMAMGTSPRRIALSLLSATGIALAGNFLGVTSKLLAFVPEDVVESTGLDTYFPRGKYKRINGPGYTFVIPREWVADTFVALAKAQRQAGQLDYSMKRRVDKATLPDAAFGPPGRLNKKGVSENGDTNVSVIISSGLKDFSLRGTLGSPEVAAQTILRSTFPEGSGRTATLKSSTEDAARRVYQFEYDIERARGPPLRAISVIASPRSGSTLLTLVVIAPLRIWTEDATEGKLLRHVAESFHMRE